MVLNLQHIQPQLYSASQLLGNTGTCNSTRVSRPATGGVGGACVDRGVGWGCSKGFFIFVFWEEASKLEWDAMVETG